MTARHPALVGFDRAADAYERGRPEYPAEAVRLLVARLGLGPGRWAMDLAAGTGKMTRALLASGARVVAVEPTRGMRAVFRRLLPRADLLAAPAEALPVRTGRLDAVVVAQAFHWFAGPVALAEIRRVLVPGGGLGIVWNTRDVSVPWVRRVSELLEEPTAGIPRAASGAWKAAFATDGARAAFSPLERAEFPFAQRAAPETVVDRFLSVSAVAALGEAERTRFASAIRAVLDSDPATRGRPELEIPYRTEVYWCRSVGPDGSG